jgi:cytochrome bd-type quinol oxidase subunit 1
MPVTKVSILFFYLRIFPGEIFRRSTWCLIVLSTISAIIFVLVDAFQCTPVNYYWRRLEGEPGRCFDPVGVAFSLSAEGIVIDFLMLGLPLYEIRKLNLPLRKKLAAGLMFGVGFL